MTVTKPSVDSYSLREVANCGTNLPEFLIEPYLQLSKHYQVSKTGSLALRWFSAQRGKWKVLYRQEKDQLFKEAKVVRKQADLLAGQQHSRYQAQLSGLTCGKPFDYVIFRGTKEVFSGSATAPMAKGQPCRIGVFGDLADGSESSRAMARRMLKEAPNLVVMTGDIVYDYGRTSEYLRHFFPVFNTGNTADGAPLMCNIACVAAVGNHDVGTPKQNESPDRNSMPDLFAYFKFWSHPENGPKLGRNSIKKASRSGKCLSKALGKALGQRSNFSFCYGSTFWLVLDANKYMNWSDKKLQRWLEAELSAHRHMPWKFVTFHQPPFNSDVKYKKDQRLRVLCEIFEKHQVDVVFSGHCHYYECSRPLRYRPLAYKGEASTTAKTSEVPGLLAMDMEFDGYDKCIPQGVLYIITGAASKLPDAAHLPSPSHFTRRLRSDKHSLTILEIEDEQLLIRQVGEDGFDLDKMVIRKQQRICQIA